MRLVLSSLLCASWLGVLVPALAVARSGEPYVRAATGEALAARSDAPPFTLERAAASMGALVASEPGSGRPELPDLAALPLGPRGCTRVAPRSTRAHEAELRPLARAGAHRERTRGPPRRA